MEAKHLPLLNILEEPISLVIPPYQRRYSWSVNQCRLLLDCILGAGRDANVNSHYLGTLVYVLYPSNHEPDQLSRLVIDGQQRLVTVALLIAALEFTNTRKSLSYQGTAEVNLFTLFPKSGGSRFPCKICLHPDDHEVFEQVIQGNSADVTEKHRITANFQFFEEFLHSSSSDLPWLYAGIKKLVVVDVLLDAIHDNVQVIFESLNATGLRLTQGDLVRNYTLMGLSQGDQQTIFESYWRAFEREFGTHGSLEHIDDFLRDFVSLRTGTVINNDAIYSRFKELYPNLRTISDVLPVANELLLHCRAYKQIAFDHDLLNSLTTLILSIRTLTGDDGAHPLLMRLWTELLTDRVEVEELRKVLHTIEQFVISCNTRGVSDKVIGATLTKVASEITTQDIKGGMQHVLQINDLTIETEIKFAIASFDPVRLIIRRLPASSYRGDVLEENALYDTSDKRLGDADSVLRIRRYLRVDGGTDNGANVSDTVITYKGPALRGRVKIREDLDLVVRTLEQNSPQRLFLALGFRKLVLYERKRESWTTLGCDIHFDEVPLLGRFVEIEGPDAETVEALAKTLQLSSEEPVTLSYAKMIEAKYGINMEVRFKT